MCFNTVAKGKVRPGQQSPSTSKACAFALKQAGLGLQSFLSQRFSVVAFFRSHGLLPQATQELDGHMHAF